MSIELSEAERHSHIWLVIEGKLKSRLASLRAQNDGALDPIQTADTRGAIKEIKALLALGADRPKF